jgi:Secretion system C-terminal sorting domain
MKTILCIIAMLSMYTIANSQILSGPGTTTSYYLCSIKYTYDEAGNRIKREYSCEWINVGGSSARKPNPQENTILESIIFPNPSNGVFSIKTNVDILNATVIVSDLTGRKIKEFAYKGNETQYDIRTLAIGQYMIQLVLPDGKQVHRLLKDE